MTGKWNLDKKQKIIVAICISILILIIFIPDHSNQTSEQNESIDINEAAKDTVLEDYIENQEKKLIKLLEKMEGVGKVSVMITLKTSVEKIVEKDVTKNISKVDESTNNENERKSTTENLSEATVFEMNEQPYVIKEIQPVVEGVVVASTGASDMEIVEKITNVIHVLYALPVHKIKVVKMEN